ncbi:3'(2'),5'-bisphosphate nucleotidase CysQ [Novosphingobium sp. 9]|uniref:3'(2'),5'-bisphosphate nucleotidase CysQ n=1 Tax=Novosphingobium sp. 9 TaxID=2025349 RepID=UPI0021B551FD|nr:3'(2'),5'-bisphosphate nucleotidase CysQ [Novosphingobium sp. 9]
MIDRQRLDAIVREAGRIALGAWPGDGHALEAWEKTPGSPVCSADLAVDAFLKRELTQLLPSAGWLSEETIDSVERLGNGLVWLVDPIDGTRDFIAGRPGWSVSVALVSASRPLLGYLYAPVRARESGGEMWVAEAGHGAFRNGAPLRASTRGEITGARFPARDLMAEESDLVRIEPPNSIALRIAMVAADEADLLASLRWGYEWDIAAATLIAREAGATVTDAFGGKLDFNQRDPRAFGVLAAAPAIHAEALDRLAERARKLAVRGRP